MAVNQCLTSGAPWMVSGIGRLPRNYLPSAVLVLAITAVAVQIAPEIAIVTGTMSAAVWKLQWSATTPSSAGDGRSPSRWIMKMLTAMAVARIATGTEFTSTTLIGPVLRN